MVELPAVLSVTLKFLVPFVNVLFGGKMALLSDEVIAIRCVTFVTGFQFESTEFTVTVTAAPAVCVFGVPVLPVGVPGAALSPGTSNCSLANAPGVTVIDDELAVLLPSLASRAVKVVVDAFVRVTVKFRVPLTNGAFNGSVALGSVEVNPTVSLTFVVAFQKASTALTVTGNDTPAA